MLRIARGVLLAGVSLALVACEGTVTGPGGEGDATFQARAIGDGGADGAQASAAGEGWSGTQAARDAEGEAQGTVSFEARLFVRTDAGSWLEITPRSAQGATVDASGRSASEVFASGRVDAGSYNRVRVVFERVEADVTGGITIGTGLLTGRIQVDLGGGGEAVVERNVDVTVESGSSATLLVDLNSDAWLSSASSRTRTVSRANFESAVRVTAQR